MMTGPLRDFHCAYRVQGIVFREGHYIKCTAATTPQLKTDDRHLAPPLEEAEAMLNAILAP